MAGRFNGWYAFAVVAGLALPGSAWAASDVANSGATSRQATTTVAAPVASAQTANLISGAVAGGFVPSSGSGGGFVPSSGTGGGFTPSTGGGPQSSLPYNTTRGMAGGDSSGRYGAWTQGTYSRVEKTETGLVMSGNVYNAVAGADYKFTDRFLGGLAVSGENTDIKTSYNNGTFKGSGVSLVPYVGLTLDPHWTADVSGGYGWLSYDVMRDSGSVTGSYDARRTFATANLTGAYTHDNWRFQPKATVSYVNEFQNAYTEKGGSAVASDTMEFGRLTAGSKIGYAVGDGIPYVKLMGEWDFLRPGSVLKASGQESFTSDGGGVVGVGYEIYSGGFTGSIEANYNSLFRDNLDLYTVALRVRYAF